MGYQRIRATMHNGYLYDGTVFNAELFLPDIEISVSLLKQERFNFEKASNSAEYVGRAIDSFEVIPRYTNRAFTELNNPAFKARGFHHPRRGH